MKIFIFLFLFTTILNGQNIDKWLDPVKEFRTELKKEFDAKKVNDYFIINQTEINADFVIPENNDLGCETGFLTKSYIFWSKDNSVWITKFDNCGIFKPIEIEDKRPTNIFINNIDQIKNEEVKPYTLIDTIIDGRKRIITREVTHSSQKCIIFYYNDKEYKKEFNSFYLMNDEDEKNLNFKYNNELKHVKLIALCEEIIELLNKQEKFIRIAE